MTVRHHDGISAQYTPVDDDGGSALATGDDISVSLTGAFLTGISLAIEALSDDDLRRIQQGVAVALNASVGDGSAWVAPKFGGVTTGLRYGGGGYETLLPSSFMRSVGPAAERIFRKLLRGGEEEDFTPAVDGSSAQLDWDLSSVRLDFFPFGVGTIVATYRVVAKRQVSAEELKRYVDESTYELVPRYNCALGAVTRDFARAVQHENPSLIKRPWITDIGVLDEDLHNRASRADGDHRDSVVVSAVGVPFSELTTSLLWFHRLYVVESVESEEPSAKWRKVMPFWNQRHEFVGLSYFPGTDSSVAFVPRRKSGEVRSDHVDSVLSVQVLQWAYYAACSEIDRTLFRMLGRLKDAANTSRELERQMNAVLVLYDEVRSFRARLNSLLVDLGGGTIALWEATASVQKLQYLFDSMDDKIDALRVAYRYRLDLLAAQREKRLAKTVAIFTVFAVVSSIVTVTAFMIGDPKNFDYLRLCWVLGVTISTVLLIMLAGREVSRRRH